MFLYIVPFLMYLFLRTKKSLHMLQQNLYDENRRYCKWLIKNIVKVMFKYDLLPFIVIVLYFLGFNSTVLAISFAVIYLFVFVINYISHKKESVKKPLVVTARIKRLLFTVFILYGVALYFLLSIINSEVLLVIMGYFQYLIVLLVQKINIPIEKYVYFSFKRKAMKKLKVMNNLKVIGITGSYGKTSSKNILSDILNVKYNALPTPKNLNTPYGLIITINNHLNKFNDILIAEMGAYKVGEIKQLCDLVHPKYGILTKIGAAHLETFGSQENIQKGKFELIESLPEDGVGVLNGDDELQLSYKLKNKCKIIYIGIDNKDVDVRAENIKVSNIGTTFDVIFKGDKQKYNFETKLLGFANVYNILAAIALGFELGINKKQLIIAVKRVKPVEHRLELKRVNDIIYIDDAYNSNPIGSKMALDVLKMMPGKKIVVTPGMVELGDMQYELNKKLGEHIADSCDEAILIGDNQTKAIQEGLREKKFDKVHILEDVKDAFSLIHKIKDKETYVLLENDLPDLFN
ncbi:MAG: UDP-N-acetylmuramoyl-tripeptide--D-alanyl-D-alanine ligase [Bacilli bacterium]|nr:UDP-N-acetylmuramoyl-tripeptide--D-alanyl-D-alanine ligase [Bacilli bacterium]